MATPYVVPKVPTGYHLSEVDADLDCNLAESKISYAHWCPVCIVHQNVRCGRRRSKSEGLEADPLREHNRTYESSAYQSHYWKRKIVKEYDLRSSTYQPYRILNRNSEGVYDSEEQVYQSMDVEGNMDHNKVPSKLLSPVKKFKERLLPTTLLSQSKMFAPISVNVAQNIPLPHANDNPKRYVESSDINSSSDAIPDKVRHINSSIHRKYQSEFPRKSSIVNRSTPSWGENGETYHNYNSMPVNTTSASQHRGYGRREMQGDGFLCPGGRNDTRPRQPFPLPSSTIQERYLHEVEVLRSKLRELRGGVDGKRLRQRSESEPGAGYSNGGAQDCSWEPKRARDISPNPSQDTVLPTTCSQRQMSISKGPSHRVHDAKLPYAPPKLKSGVALRKVLPATYDDRASLSSDSDFADDDHACDSGEDGDSKGVPGEDSEEDDQSVMSSLTTLSSDSNTPSLVGETLGCISLNDGGRGDQFMYTLPTTSEAIRKSKQLPKSLRPSLFSHVPPYIFFSMHDVKGEPLHPDVARHMKWKLSTITPLVVRRTLVNSGFKLVRIPDMDENIESGAQSNEEKIRIFGSKSLEPSMQHLPLWYAESNDWCGTWGKHMKSMCFKTLKEFQKINHFPGTFQIGRKDRLWKNLYRLMTKFGKKEFGFIPRTFVLPQDSKLLRQAWEKSCGKEKWIIKPPASARGTGIKVVNRWAQIPKKRPLVVQKYISEPYLINGSKFDLRLYVLVTSMNPLRIYIYDDGLVRFASVKYSGDMACLSDRYMHLTNYSINKLSSQYTQNEDASACQGHKWTVKTLWSYLEKDGIDVKALWEDLVDLVIKTIISGESSINHLTRANLLSRYCSYELFGIDVLLDETLKPWLLEVNISPSLHSSSPLDLAVKGPMVRDLMNMAGYQIPNKLSTSQHEELLSMYGVKDSLSSLCFDRRLYTTAQSKEERLKHSSFMNMSREDYLDDILHTLTPDDVRHLIQSEDELTQAGRFIRIFPTPYTYTYHEFFETPRYYNQLFDAWESKYYENRQEGIQVLEALCRQKVHLTIPQPPSGPKFCASQPILPSIDTIPVAWEDKNDEKTLPERKVLSLSSVALYRAARPRSGKPVVVMKPFPRSSYISRKPKTSCSSPTTTTRTLACHNSDILMDRGAYESGAQKSCSPCPSPSTNVHQGTASCSC